MLHWNQWELKALESSDFPRTWKTVACALEQQWIPGCVLGYVPLGSARQRMYLGAWGSRSLLPSCEPMTVGTVFDIASLTKVMATAPLAVSLVQRGWLDWETKVRAILPEFPDEQVKIHHLLSHTSGQSAWAPFWEMLESTFSRERLPYVSIEKRQKAMRRFVFSVPREYEPGSFTKYSDLSFLTLGFVLEEVLQMPLDQAVSSLLWKPMDLKEAFYQKIHVPAWLWKFSDAASTQQCPWRQAILQGQVDDRNCWAMGGYGGHAGVFATAQAVLHFVVALIDGFFSKAMLETMWTQVKSPLGCERTLGWDTPSEMGSTGRFFSKKTVGHLGFTGTSLWVDRQDEVLFVVLSNRVHPSSENQGIRLFRPRVHDAFREDLQDLQFSI
jgi:CubicO group peptidase (beta-lactamase class C family)